MVAPVSPMCKWCKLILSMSQILMLPAPALIESYMPFSFLYVVFDFLLISSNRESTYSLLLYYISDFYERGKR